MLVITMIFAYCWKTCEDSIRESNQIKEQGKWKYGMLVLSIFGTFLPMYLINACMSYVGNDYANYYTYYNNIASGRGQDVEIGYKLINIFVARTGLGFQWVYFITCFIAYTLLIFCIRKYSQNYALSYLLFFSGGFFFLLGLNQIRQFVAVGCVFYAFQFIENKKPLFYFALVIIGGLFHVTAYIMLPFYFILGKKIRLSMYTAGAVTILPINFFFNDIMTWLFKTFMPRYLNSNYISRTYELNVPYLTMILVTTVVVMFLVSRQKEELSVTDRVFFNACLIGMIIGVFCSWLPEYTRFVYYFLIPAISYITKLVGYLKGRGSKLVCIVSVIMADIIYVSTIVGYSNVIPYKSFF